MKKNQLTKLLRFTGNDFYMSCKSKKQTYINTLILLIFMRGGSKKRVYNSIDSTLIGLNLYVVCLVIIFYVLVFQNQRISIEADALLIDKIDNEPTSIANEPKIQDEITAESSDKAEKPSEPVKDEAIVKFEADDVNEK